MFYFITLFIKLHLGVNFKNCRKEMYKQYTPMSSKPFFSVLHKYLVNSAT